MADFDKQNTRDRVVAIIATKLSIDSQAVKEDATLQDIGADSLDLVEIIMKLEEQFAIEIDDAQAETFKNVHDVIDYVHSIRVK